MIYIDRITCIHGVEVESPESVAACETCIDLLQIEDGEEFLERIGMGVVKDG